MSWFKRKTRNGEIYTNTPQSKDEHHEVYSKGAIVQQLGELGQSASLHKSGLIITKTNVETVEQAVTLPAGNYEYYQSSYDTDKPERLVSISLRSDTYKDIPTISAPIIEDINNFIANESVYRDVGAAYRRGYLLYGPPGEGKSALVRNILSDHALTKDAVVIHTMSVPSRQFIENIRVDSRMKVFVFEELAAAINSNNLDLFLNFLDGELTVDNSVVFATTNYPERLPANIVDRPSRFDFIYKLKNPTRVERALIVEHYMSREATEVEIESSSGLSTAAVKEACLLTRIQRIEFREAVKKLKTYHDLAKSDFGEMKSLGLSRDAED